MLDPHLEVVQSRVSDGNHGVTPQKCSQLPRETRTLEGRNLHAVSRFLQHHSLGDFQPLAHTHVYFSRPKTGESGSEAGRSCFLDTNLPLMPPTNTGKWSIYPEVDRGREGGEVGGIGSFEVEKEVLGAGLRCMNDIDD